MLMNNPLEWQASFVRAMARDRGQPPEILRSPDVLWVGDYLFALLSQTPKVAAA